MINPKKQKHIVLVTDDSAIDRQYIESSLAASTESTLSVYGSESANELYNSFDRLLRDGDTPSLILLDFLLGGSNGLTVSSYLRKHYPPVPIVVFGSCLGSDDNIADLYRIGVNAYIIKPQDKSHYEPIIQTIVSLWLHSPQPLWSFRDDRGDSINKTHTRKSTDRRVYDRRDIRDRT